VIVPATDTVASTTGLTVVVDTHGAAVAGLDGVAMPLMVTVAAREVPGIASAPPPWTTAANDDAGSIPMRSPTTTSNDDARDNGLLLFTNTCFILFLSLKTIGNTRTSGSASLPLLFPKRRVGHPPL
jgi:hypothetical protein